LNYRLAAITRPPKHHFFGYYDMRPWDPTGRYHLLLEVDFMDRPPTDEDEAVIGVVDLREGNRFLPLSRTRAWNFQQGAMLHWHPAVPGTVLFNDRRRGHFVCVAHEIDSGAERVLGPAIGALSDDGRLAATLNYARIAVTRPGYGYEGLADPAAEQPMPESDGLGLLDTASGDYELIVSMASLAPLQSPELEYGREKVWFNHVLFNPSATRLAFLVRWAAGRSWVTQMWTVGLDGADPVRVLDGPLVSHYDWKDDETLIAWAGVDGVDSVWELDARRRARPRPLFERCIRRDGHICFSHDRRWVATDTYPGPDGMRELSIVEYPAGRAVSLGRYHSPIRPDLHEIRCDLHPSWSPDDRQLAFDGMHEGTRQRYVVELEP